MYIALDIGTTHIKAVAFSEAGAVLGAAECPTQTLSAPFGWSEQAPEQVFSQVVSALSTLLQDLKRKKTTEKPRVIALSAAMHGLVGVDKSGNPLTQLMLWSDVRSNAEAKALMQSGGGGLELYQRTGVPIHPMSPLVKLIWLRKNQPDVFQKAYKFLDVKGFIWQKITGKYELDISCASATGLMSLYDHAWDKAALAVAGISAARLPRLVPPAHCASAVHPDIPPDIPWLMGASDGALANLGSGATGPGQVCVTIGTSSAIRAMTSEPMLDEQMRTFCYRLDDKRYIVGGASNNGANALEWLRNTVFQSTLSAEAFANQALLVPPGADGLQFFPYLLGERAPLWDASARASFVGLTAFHGQAHLVRAVMEGVLLNLKAIGDVLEEKMGIDTLFASGGFSRNTVWVKMLSDIFQKKVELQALGVDASARGAYLLAREAMG